MNILLHERSGRRILVVDGFALREADVDKTFTETFDELVALVKPEQAHPTAEAERRRPLLREGKSIEQPKDVTVPQPVPSSAPPSPKAKK